ncbi:hypothetical protein PR001_g23936, partial [Phytophthora rubi]
MNAPRQEKNRISRTVIDRIAVQLNGLESTANTMGGSIMETILLLREENERKAEARRADEEKRRSEERAEAKAEAEERRHRDKMEMEERARRDGEE